MGEGLVGLSSLYHCEGTITRCFPPITRSTATGCSSGDIINGSLESFFTSKGFLCCLCLVGLTKKFSTVVWIWPEWYALFFKVKVLGEIPVVQCLVDSRNFENPFFSYARQHWARCIHRNSRRHWPRRGRGVVPFGDVSYSANPRRCSQSVLRVKYLS